jgi:hypothetical protein
MNLRLLQKTQQHIFVIAAQADHILTVAVYVVQVPQHLCTLLPPVNIISQKHHFMNARQISNLVNHAYQKIIPPMDIPHGGKPFIWG